MLIRGRTLQVPILQGGMGVGVSLGGLAGAVAAQGALGCISTADTGFREPDFEKDPNGANLRALTKEIEKARQIARGKGMVAIKRDISEIYSILPFEVPFYEGKHNYPIHYVGNPTADEVRQFRASYDGTLDIPNDNGLPVIALLAGSRLQEIKDNLPSMIEATRHLSDRYQMVLAGAPGVAPDYYDRFLHGTGVRIVYGKTYPLLSHAVAALVTSGTATLETALFGVPQVVCYRMAFPKLVALLRRLLLKVKYISLVNLIADAEVVRELVADTFTVDNIRRELDAILPGSPARDVMLRGYEEVSRRLGTSVAPDNAASLIVKALSGRT